jgi:hypothetical protein
MTTTIDLIFFLLAAVLFGVAVVLPPRQVQLIAAGLCSFTIPFILAAAHLH